jgi:hypothetical protein
VIKLPKKKYTPKQDVQLRKEAASEVRKQYPIIEDQHIAKYLTQIGNRLVAAAPTELKQSVYEYSFTPVNLKDCATGVMVTVDAQSSSSSLNRDRSIASAMAL